MTKYGFFAIAATAGAVCAAAAAIAASPPSQEDIAAAFNLRAGVRVPVVVAGTNYEAQYVRIEARRDGDYALVFHLRK